jgi:hypothetical protein
LFGPKQHALNGVPFLKLGNLTLMSTQWFAVQSKPRQECTAKVQLERQGYTAYLPMMTVRKRKRAAWTTSIEALFPRYLFVHADVNQQSLAPVRSTVGVSGLVRFGTILRLCPMLSCTIYNRPRRRRVLSREKTAGLFGPAIKSRC